MFLREFLVDQRNESLILIKESFLHEPDFGDLATAPIVA